VLCGKSKDAGTGEYMAEVRISSRFERPCAVVEDPRDALADAGEREPRHRKVHSLIDKVYDPNNLEEAWQRVWENRGSAGIDGVTIAAFAEREDELLRISRKEGQRFTACRSTVSHQVGPVLVRQDVVDFHSVTYAGQALDGYPRARARAH
jgi:hypothetical protein